jgi:NAD(P)H-dependent FMN reductase
MKILVILGSTREGRVGDKVAQWVMEKTKNVDSVEFEFVDLRDLKLPYYNEPAHPSMVEEDNYADDRICNWIDKVREADGFLIVTPEYNHGYPAVLKTALDYPYIEWNKKPVGFVSYGGLAGGARAVEQLRLVSIELQMAPIRDTVVIPGIGEFVEEKGFKNNERFDKTLGEVFEQLIWWGTILKSAREDETQKTEIKPRTIERKNENNSQNVVPPLNN